MGSSPWEFSQSTVIFHLDPFVLLSPSKSPGFSFIIHSLILEFKPNINLLKWRFCSIFLTSCIRNAVSFWKMIYHLVLVKCLKKLGSMSVLSRPWRHDSSATFFLESTQPFFFFRINGRGITELERVVHQVSNSLAIAQKLLKCRQSRIFDRSCCHQMFSAWQVLNSIQKPQKIAKKSSHE